jgi:hypothetical protein
MELPIADLGLSGLIAITADMSQSTAVIAFLALRAVFGHVAFRQQ